MSRPTLAGSLVGNDEQIEQRLALGDRLHVPRPVEHFGILRTKRSAAAAIAALQGLGYEVESTSGLFRTSVEAAKPERLDGDGPTRFVTEVFGVFDRHEGSYDGWGSMVVTAAAGEPSA